MKLTDYLLDFGGYDWAELLRPWSSLLPSEVTLWMMNRFGDLFVVLSDGSIHMLSVVEDRFERLANDRDDFARRIDEDNNADDWLMIPLVDELVAAGKLLEPGQCYSCGMPPFLGGEFRVGNVIVLPIEYHFGAYGSFHEQLAGVPEGTTIVLKVQRPPDPE